MATDKGEDGLWTEPPEAKHETCARILAALADRLAETFGGVPPSDIERQYPPVSRGWLTGAETLRHLRKTGARAPGRSLDAWLAGADIKLHAVARGPGGVRRFHVEFGHGRRVLWAEASLRPIPGTDDDCFEGRFWKHRPPR